MILVIGKDSQQARTVGDHIGLSQFRVIPTPEAMDGLWGACIILMPGHRENRRWEEFQTAIRSVMADGTSHCYTMNEGQEYAAHSRN